MTSQAIIVGYRKRRLKAPVEWKSYKENDKGV